MAFSSTSPATHIYDLEYIIDKAKDPTFKYYQTFKNILIDKEGEVKAVWIRDNDGGTDQQVRSVNSMYANAYFFIKYDLDYLFISQSAPDMSFINRAERFMSLLSGPLSGLILSHDHFGSHLKSKKIIDQKKFYKNMMHACKILADKVWDGRKINNNNIHATTMKPDSEKEILAAIAEMMDWIDEWLQVHCVASRHSLQFSKCTDVECCDPPRTGIFNLLKSRFVSEPYVLRHNDDGNLELVMPDDVKKDDYWPDLHYRYLFFRFICFCFCF